MVEELKHMDAWWRPLWEAADVIVFNLVGHHLRALPGFNFKGHATLVRGVLESIKRHTKRTASLIMRTSNVGHLDCMERLAPLASASEAWRLLGGWHWRKPPSGFTAQYYGQPRTDVSDRFDWRAPGLHERDWARQLRSAFPALARRFAILNVSHVDARADGHVAGAMRWHHDPRKASKGSNDCLHYCVPGPTDAWAAALYNLLLHTAMGEQSQ